MPAVELQPGFLFGLFKYRPADPVTDRRITDFSLILAALLFLDILTTDIILRFGGIEQNPAMVGIVASPFVHIAIKAGTLLLIIIVSLIAERNIKGSAIPFYCVIITMYLVVFVHNTFVLVPRIAGF